jgi:hypothetical protein
MQHREAEGCIEVATAYRQTKIDELPSSVVPATGSSQLNL